MTVDVKREVFFKCHFHYDTYAEVWCGYTHAGYFLSGPQNFFLLLYFEHVKIIEHKEEKKHKQTIK